MNENWTERLIDAHLEEPNTTEPSLGFESRVLARVAEQRAARKRPVFWMIWASAAVAAAIIAVVFLARPVPKPAHVQTAKVVVPEQLPRIAAPKVGGEPLVSKRAVTPKPRHDVRPAAVSVRQEVFPAPSPLSEQEQMAFAYLRGTPRSEVLAMSRPEPELPQEMNQAIPGQEVNRTLQDSRSGSTR